MGCLLTMVKVRLSAGSAIVAWAMLAVAVLAGRSSYDMALTIFAWGSVVLVASTAPIRAWSPLVRLGLISYGIYLWHMPQAIMFRDTLLGGDGWPLRVVAWIGVATASVALALASERWVERPLPRAALTSPPDALRVGLAALDVRALQPEDKQRGLAITHRDPMDVVPADGR